VYIKREQSKYFEKLKTEVSDEKIVLQVDFAENFNMKEQDEIQKAHWNTKSLSIFTAFVWSKSENFSFALPSLDVTHDKFVVDSALKIILNHIKTNLGQLLVCLLLVYLLLAGHSLVDTCSSDRCSSDTCPAPYKKGHLPAGESLAYTICSLNIYALFLKYNKHLFS
jgi:hypothetical protein